ncbi:MAG TPA: hypothetical protein VGH74_06450 [Planctomycetaceae bacterium]
MFRSRLHLCLLVLLLGITVPLCRANEPSVFSRPALARTSRQLQFRAVLLARSGQLPEALAVCRQAYNTAPFSAMANYNLACLEARNGQADESLDTLKRAIELGFRDARQITQDVDFESVRNRPEFTDLVDEAKKPFERPTPQPGPIDGGIAWVGPENAVWDETTNLLRTAFEWQRPEKPAPVIRDHGEIGTRLSQWYSEGTAAGHFGDLYDNCDRDHSNLDYARFPQLARIEYRPGIADEAPYGLQNRLLHGGVVLGNSSTANTAPLYWRSNPRQAYLDPASMASLVTQYFHNHLYVYPEHRDHDPGRNGKGGFGDVYPANTPYVLISQGSSGTDTPFLDALACTMAAFRPEVKRKLVEHGLFVATLQQIFRSSNKTVRRPDDYLTGPAHPSVFEGSQIDGLKMVESAHAMTIETIPPLVRLRVEQQDAARVGRDYFDVADREILFDTPCAIARIGRSVQYRRSMIVSARDSVDPNQRPLKFRWVVLRGDESRISLKPLDDAGSRAEVEVAWHPRRKTHPASDIESNRVDIGVFAHNGANWSAPAFVCWFFLDNEDREYDEQGRIRSVTYHGGTDQGNYVDPFIQTPKTWKDSYQYTDEGRLLGWTRSRGTGPAEMTEQFTPDGGLVINRDDRGRPASARAVRYVAQAAGKQLPVLVQQLGDEVWHYGYESDEDPIGKIKSREKSAP